MLLDIKTEYVQVRKQAVVERKHIEEKSKEKALKLRAIGAWEIL